MQWSRANPEQVKMGSSGTGTSSHLNIAAINRFADAKILHVPYRGGGPAINDLLSGTIDMMFDVMPALMPHVEAGRFKALAVSSGDPIALLPQVPGMKAFADLGLGAACADQLERGHHRGQYARPGGRAHLRGDPHGRPPARIHRPHAPARLRHRAQRKPRGGGRR